jgi:hypothetical protein
MNRSTLALTLGLLLALSQAALAGETGFKPESLEPCMNGAVSASGLYPAQALENRARLEARSVASIREDSK